MKGAILCFILLCSAVGANAQSAMDRAKTHFARTYPNLRYEDVVEEGGFVIGFINTDGLPGEAVYGEDGVWLYTSVSIKDVPANVRSAATRTYPGARFTGFKKVTRQDGVMYNLYLEMRDGGAFDIYLDSSGREI